jgi:hypothetical protein
LRNSRRRRSTTLTTEDGKKISLAAGRVAIPQDRIVKRNHFPICGEAVNNQRIPVVHIEAK